MSSTSGIVLTHQSKPRSQKSVTISLDIPLNVVFQVPDGCRPDVRGNARWTAGSRDNIPLAVDQHRVAVTTIGQTGSGQRVGLVAAGVRGGGRSDDTEVTVRSRGVDCHGVNGCTKINNNNNNNGPPVMCGDESQLGDDTADDDDGENHQQALKIQHTHININVNDGECSHPIITEFRPAELGVAVDDDSHRASSSPFSNVAETDANDVEGLGLAVTSSCDDVVFDDDEVYNDDGEDLYLEHSDSGSAVDAVRMLVGRLGLQVTQSSCVDPNFFRRKLGTICEDDPPMPTNGDDAAPSSLTLAAISDKVVAIFDDLRQIRATDESLAASLLSICSQLRHYKLQRHCRRHQDAICDVIDTQQERCHLVSHLLPYVDMTPATIQYGYSSPLRNYRLTRADLHDAGERRFSVL